MLGNEKFQQQIESLTQRSAKPKMRGCDRRSFKVKKTIEVCPFGCESLDYRTPTEVLSKGIVLHT